MEKNLDLNFLPRELLYNDDILNTSYDKLKKRNQLIRNLVQELDSIDEKQNEEYERRTERVSKVSRRNKYIKKDNSIDENNNLNQSFLERISYAFGCFKKN